MYCGKEGRNWFVEIVGKDSLRTFAFDRNIYIILCMNVLTAR